MSAVADRGAAPSGAGLRPGPWQVAGPVLHVPNLLAGRAYPGRPRPAWSGPDGRGVTVAVGSDLVQQRMLDRCAEAGPELRALSDEQFTTVLGEAADGVDAWLRDGVLDDHLRAVSELGGLPVRRVARGLTGVTRLMRRLPEIMAVQAPNRDLAAYRSGVSGASWSWQPAGRTCVVRVPDNFPTIAIEWLQVLGARRPVVVNTSDGDPVLSTVLAAALSDAGLPPGSVSVYHGRAERLWSGTDQLVWPGEHPPPGRPATGTKTYHFGRSKVVLADPDPPDHVLGRLTRLAFEGSGRLCTNVSAVAVLGDDEAADRVAGRLARRFAEIAPLPPDDPSARVASWPDRNRALATAATIEREVAAGAIDHTATVTAAPLLGELGGRTFLRPTVLRVDRRSSLFRVELPFPFVTVASCPRSTVVGDCRDSLVVGVVGPTDDPGVAGLLADLVAEPTVGKVFAGDHFDRGYDPTDPQEGFLADFLFQKKAVRGW